MKYAALPVLVILALGLTACGGGGPSASSSTPPASSSSSDAPAVQMPVVQPCDEIDVGKLQMLLGYSITKNTGTSDAPTCTLTPAVEGGEVFDLNYQWWFQGGLESAWKTIADQVQGKVSSVTVPGADDAKLVVRTAKKAAYVTGFVEDGSLIQVVNGLARPHDAAKLKQATLELMAQLSAGAPTPTATPSAG